MPDRETAEQLSDAAISVTVDWAAVYGLKRISMAEGPGREEYASTLERLLLLGVLSREEEGAYTVEIPGCDGGGTANPTLGGEVLYIKRVEDAEKIKERFTNSLVHKH